MHVCFASVHVYKCMWLHVHVCAYMGIHVRGGRRLVSDIFPWSPCISETGCLTELELIGLSGLGDLGVPGRAVCLTSTATADMHHPPSSDMGLGIRTQLPMLTGKLFPLSCLSRPKLMFLRIQFFTGQHISIYSNARACDLSRYWQNQSHGALVDLIVYLFLHPFVTQILIVCFGAWWAIH